MTTQNKLAASALVGLLTAGLLAAAPAFAEHHEKGSCKGAAGCNGKPAAEKSECKGHAEKASCEGKDKDAHSCNGKAEGEKASCTGKDAK